MAAGSIVPSRLSIGDFSAEKEVSLISRVQEAEEGTLNKQTPIAAVTISCFILHSQANRESGERYMGLKLYFVVVQESSVRRDWAGLLRGCT